MHEPFYSKVPGLTRSIWSLSAGFTFAISCSQAMAQEAMSLEKAAQKAAQSVQESTGNVPQRLTAKHEKTRGIDDSTGISSVCSKAESGLYGIRTCDLHDVNVAL